VESSDFYGGGQTGFGPRAEDADFEALVVRCCTRQDWVSIVVSGNRTFEQPGSRVEGIGTSILAERVGFPNLAEVSIVSRTLVRVA
jgi:hypothetical protein